MVLEPTAASILRLLVLVCLHFQRTLPIKPCVKYKPWQTNTTLHGYKLPAFSNYVNLQNDSGKQSTNSFISAKDDPSFFEEDNGKEQDANFENSERDNSHLSVVHALYSQRGLRAERNRPSGNRSSKSPDELSETSNQPSESRLPSDEGQLGDTNMTQAGLSQVDGTLREEVRNVFLEFARFGSRNTETRGLDVYRFKKLCVECKLVRDTKALPCIELIFFKVCYHKDIAASSDKTSF